MIVLSYDNAKRSLVNMAIYLVCTSLVIKGFGFLIEANTINAVQGLFTGSSINFSMPEFNMDSLSFDFIANTIKEKISEIVTVVVPSTLGFIGAHQVHLLTANKAVLTASARIALKV